MFGSAGLGGINEFERISTLSYQPNEANSVEKLDANEDVQAIA